MKPVTLAAFLAAFGIIWPKEICDRPPRTGCKVAHVDLAVRLEIQVKLVGWQF